MTQSLPTPLRVAPRHSGGSYSTRDTSFVSSLRKRFVRVNRTRLAHANVGLLFSAYAADLNTLAGFAKEVHGSVLQLKKRCPTLPIAIAAGPFDNATLALSELADVFIRIPSSHVVRGRFERADRRSRQWLTRTMAIATFPFSLTVSVDSTISICSCALLESLVTVYNAGVDVAFNTQIPGHPNPHNWMLAIRSSESGLALIEGWLVHQLSMNYAGDDQGPLKAAIKDIRKRRSLQVRRLPNKVAAAFFPLHLLDHGVNQSVRVTKILDGEVQAFHSCACPDVCSVVNSATYERILLCGSTTCPILVPFPDCDVRLQKIGAASTVCTRLIDPSDQDRPEISVDPSAR